MNRKAKVPVDDQGGAYDCARGALDALSRSTLHSNALDSLSRENARLAKKLEETELHLKAALRIAYDLFNDSKPPTPSADARQLELSLARYGSHKWVCSSTGNLERGHWYDCAYCGKTEWISLGVDTSKLPKDCPYGDTK